MVSGLLALGLAGCAAPEPVIRIERVEVPVVVKATPPAWLGAPYKPAVLPVFILPSDPQASSALSAEGEKNLKLMLHDLIMREAAWRAWSTAP